MKPSEWHVGMTIREGTSVSGSPVFAVITGRNPKCEGWLLTRADNGRRWAMADRFAEQFDRHPATFSDLSRRPEDEPVGARAVLLHNPRVLVTKKKDGWFDDSGERWYLSAKDVAPLSPLPESAPEEAPVEGRWTCKCGTWTNKSREKPCTKCGLTFDEAWPAKSASTPPVEQPCERCSPGFTLSCCQSWEMNVAVGKKPIVDPCRPCALRIDAAEEQSESSRFDVLGSLSVSVETAMQIHFAKRLRDANLRPLFTRDR